MGSVQSQGLFTHSRKELKVPLAKTVTLNINKKFAFRSTFKFNIVLLEMQTILCVCFTSKVKV